MECRPPSQLLEREIHILQRQDRGGEEPLRCRFAEVDDPIIVGARERVGDVRVADLEEAFGEPGRIKQCAVDSHRVHIGKPGLRVRGALGGRMPRVRIEFSDRFPGHAGTPQRMARQVGVRAIAENLAVDLEVGAGAAFLSP